MKCAHCGTELTPEERFCGECGAPRPKLPARFEKTEKQFAALKNQRSSGELSETEYQAALKNLIVQDADGTHWMLGTESGKWYRSDGHEWVGADPPTESAESAQTKTTAAPAPPHLAQRGLPWLWIALGGAGLLGIVACVVGLVLLLAMSPRQETVLAPTAAPGSTLPFPTLAATTALQPVRPALTPTVMISGPRATAVGLFEKAKALYDQGQYDLAISTLNSAIQSDPGYVDAYYYRGQAQRKKSNLDQAIADYSKAIELNPKHFNAYLMRGWTQTTKKDYNSAIADFGKAIELDPKNYDAYDFRGYAYYLNRNLDQAIADYDKAIGLDPKKAVAYFDRGLAENAKGNLDQAIADYNKAIELDPTEPTYYYDRGRAFRQKGLKAQALADFQTYLRLAPDATDRAEVEQWIRELQAR